MKNQTTFLDQSTQLDKSIRDQSVQPFIAQTASQSQPSIFSGIYIDCSQGKNGYGYCLDCASPGIICADQSCQCYKAHAQANCQNIKRISTFNKKIQNKRKNTKILQNISTLNQQMVDILSSMQQTIKNRFQFFGMNQADKTMFDKINNYSKNKQSISSKDIIQYEKSYQAQQKKWFVEQTKYYRKLISKVKNQIYTRLQKIQNIILNEHMEITKQINDAFFRNSTILGTADKQRNYLIQTLHDLGTIKKAVQIYSTQKNAFTFNGFQENCQSHKNLLYLVKSQTNKIFGGYCPVQIQLNKKGSYVDSTMTSKIFDLTHNIKSKQVKIKTTLTIKSQSNENKQQQLFRIIFGDIDNPSLTIIKALNQFRNFNYINFQCSQQSKAIFEIKKNHKNIQPASYSYCRQKQVDDPQQVKILYFQVYELFFST